MPVFRLYRASIDIRHQDDSQVFIFVAFRCQHFWGLVEVQIAATVATASYRNFSVATILGRAACLLSVFSQNFNQIHSLLDRSWLGLMSCWNYGNIRKWWTSQVDFLKKGVDIGWMKVTGGGQTHPNLVQHHSQWGASLQLDCFCFLGDTGLLNPEAAYDAWHAAQLRLKISQVNDVFC